MTFLDPVTGWTALAAAGSLTLLWYFLKLRRRPLRVSSVLLWSRAARDLEVNAPLRWIRPSWILLLQLLAVALLSGAAGRPAVTGAGATPDRWVLVIDTSASMRAQDASAGGTRLEEARRRARETVDRMSPGAEAMLVSFALSARLEAPMTGSSGVLRAAVDAVKPTDQPGSIAGALELVAAQLGERTAGVRVVVFSDGGFRDGPSGAPLGSAQVRYVRCGPEPGAESGNTGIVAISARRDPVDPVVLRAFVRVVRTGAPGEVAVTATYSGELAGVQTVQTNPDGEATAVFETRAPGAGVLRLAVAGRDALVADDVAHVVLGPARGSGVLMVSPGAEDADPFLERALEIATGGPVRRVSLGEWNTGRGGAASVVVFDRAEPERVPEAPSLHISAGLPAAGVRLVDTAGGPAERVLAWEREHPAMRYFSLNGLLIAGSPAIELAGDTRAEVLATGSGGPLIAALDDRGYRRVVTAFGPADSNWETDPSFALFVALATEWLSPWLSGIGEAYSTADSVTVRAAAGVVEAEGPMELRAVTRRNGFARLGSIPLAGLYTLRGAADGTEHLAVNMVSETESRLSSRESTVIGGRTLGASGIDAVIVRELWRWFVLTAALLASLEWLIYARKMRV